MTFSQFGQCSDINALYTALPEQSHLPRARSQDASARKLLQGLADIAISSFLTVGGSSDQSFLAQSPYGSPDAELAAVAGSPVDHQTMAPALAKQVQNAQTYDLEGDAPGNEEPYTFNLSNPNQIPDQNADRRQSGLNSGCVCLCQPPSWSWAS